MREFRHARKIAMPDFVLIAVGILVPVLAMVLIPAVLMVSTIRFRSFKTLDLQARRPYTVLIFIAAGIMAIATHPRFVLLGLAYTYLASAFVGMAITRFKHRGGPTHEPHAVPIDPPARSTRN